MTMTTITADELERLSRELDAAQAVYRVLEAFDQNNAEGIEDAWDRFESARRAMMLYAIERHAELAAKLRERDDLAAKLGETNTFLVSVIAGPRGNADPGWEGDVRFACRIMEEASELQTIINRKATP